VSKIVDNGVQWQYDYMQVWTFPTLFSPRSAVKGCAMMASLKRDVGGLVVLWAVAVTIFALLSSCSESSEAGYVMLFYVFGFLSTAGPFFIGAFWMVSFKNCKNTERVFKEQQKGWDPPSVILPSKERRKRRLRRPRALPPA
jgi:hypothetical protein